jgi:uncharacterized protein YdeI (YjbR/CyaY-like superfamily)
MPDWTDGVETFFAEDQRAWRGWLEEHHAARNEVWLVLFKKHVERQCVSLEEAVEEALCFGWIDGKLKRVDDERHILRFCPRKPNSIWSESNKRRVRQLIESGRMTPAGLALVDEAKRNGQWDRAAERENIDDLPPDLEQALAADGTARAAFARLAPSHKKAYLLWVAEARRPETRARRIAEVVKRVARGRKPGDEAQAVEGPSSTA